jgi:2-amino-4-hydroxy-6-hydroxymethyldihydropteridine diphosphokinase
MNTAFLSLGSNIGNRLEFLYGAIKAMDLDDRITLVRSSSLYETDPVGFVDQAQFLNMVLKIETTYEAEKLLDRCLEIEQSLGRVRHQKWGPRTIDLDILLFNQENIETEKLIVPHPRLKERAFVLIPLKEVDPGLMEVKQSSYPLLTKEGEESEGVRLWKQINGEDAFGLFEN